MNVDQRTFFRQHARMKGFDYHSSHAYFVTICTGQRACVFGEVVKDEVRLSRCGIIASECWLAIPEHHPHVELDAFVVMPNHVHGLLLFAGDVCEATATSELPVAATPASPRAHGPSAGSLSAVIGSFKSAVSRQINRMRPGSAKDLWQTNFYEHVVRNDRAHDRIRDYIFSNPQRWADDEENPNGTGRDNLDAFVGSLRVLSELREAPQASQLQGDNRA
jgi:putative transposase